MVALRCLVLGRRATFRDSDGVLVVEWIRRRERFGVSFERPFLDSCWFMVSPDRSTYACGTLAGLLGKRRTP